MLREIAIHTNSPFQLCARSLPWSLQSCFTSELPHKIKLLACVLQDTSRNCTAYRLGTRRRVASGDGLASAPSAIRSVSGRDDPWIRLAGERGIRPFSLFCFVFVLSLSWQSIIFTGVSNEAVFCRRLPRGCSSLPLARLPGEHHGLAKS